MGGVARKLLVVDAEAVSLGVWINEQASLEKRIRRRLDIRDQVRRGKGQLTCGQLEESTVIMQQNGIPVQSRRNSFADFYSG